MINIDAITILNEWAKFSDYEPNKKTFNLGMYWIDKGNKVIEKLQKYDDTGALAVLYAKRLCKEFLLECRPKSYFDIIEDPSDYNESIKMWNSFNSSFVLNLEKAFKEGLNNIVDKVTDGRLIGDFKTEISNEKLLDNITIAINGLEKCKFDLYAKGLQLNKDVQFNTYIHTFESCEECISVINNSVDAIYLCYIRKNDSAYGYFGFFVKNGDNIFSISERIEEVYPDQNSHKRNHRDTDNKEYDLFPYNYIFSFEEHDYKGYAGKHIINENNLAIFNLGMNAYLPLVIAMFLIKKMYVGKELDEKISYINNFVLKTNINQLKYENNNELIIFESDTPLAKTYKDSIIQSFDKNKFLNGDYSEKFNEYKKEESHLDRGIFNNEKQIFVDLYGKDFDERYLDIKNLSDDTLLLPNLDDNNEDIMINNMTKFEVMGSEKRINMIHYWWIRKALAKHIKENMDKEFKNFGGLDKVKQWYKNVINDNIDYIFNLIINYNNKSNDFLSIIDEGCGFWQSIIINKPIKNDRQWITGYECIINSTKSTLFFKFEPKTFEDIVNILGVDKESVPKILKGWTLYSNYEGNSILDMVDPVSMIEHPLSSRSNNSFSFSFIIAFSKRGYAKLMKDNNKEVIKFWKEDIE